jgi:2-oxoglutarate dehydrogenase E2 component (dihydrolipoamide succinyltransferase)
VEAADLRDKPETEYVMAIIEVHVPQLSESVAEATLLNWHKKVGEAVARDENLIDIETDKVVLELPAPMQGVVVEIVKPDGSTVVSGEVIARIDTEATASAGAPSSAPAAASAAPSPAPAAAKATASSGAIAMPAAAKMLSENQMSASAVAGTGKDGRVTKGDVIQALAQPKPSAAPTPAAVRAALPEVPAHIGLDLGDRPAQRVPMSRLRARIAERLLESQATNAILTTFNEVNMQPVMDLRNKYKDKFEKEHGVKLGFMSFFVKAAVVVPILRNVDQMSIADIEKKIGEFGTKAKDGKLTLEELSGGTFSISNGGVFGSMLSTPIINPPQSAILGVHATKERAVVEDGQIVIRPMNYLALSYDHRIIDGREAVLGLVAMKEALEDPARLLLDL